MVSASVITGKRVVGVNGDEIGEVKDAEFNSATWKITSLVVKLTDKAAAELGYTRISGGVGAVHLTRGTKSVFMPVDVVSAIGDVITVNKTIVELEQGQILKRYSE